MFAPHTLVIVASTQPTQPTNRPTHHHPRELQPAVLCPRLAKGTVRDQIKYDKVGAPDAHGAEVVQDGVPDCAVFVSEN